LTFLGLVALISVVAVACGDDDNAGDGSGNGEATAAATEPGSSASPTGGDGERIKVVTTVAPITSLAENIAGTAADVEGIVPEGTNSHTYEPPPSVAQLLAEADIIFANGLALEEPTFELAEANAREGVEVVRLGDMTVTEAEWKFDFSFPEEDGDPNPHLWPNVPHAMEYAAIIHAEMVELDPANQQTYDANYQELNARLEQLHEAMQTATQTVPEQNRRLLTYHDSWAYWAETYGFTVVGAVQPSDFSEPSAAEVADLIEQVREEQIPAVFGSEVFPSDVLETIANETDAEYIDELRDDDLPGEPGDDNHSYIGLMVENMRIMLPALGGDASAFDDVPTGLVFEGESPAEYPQ
jgi:ABC-type Zn uptake system ZnuABC Zn-binding protein ZnuA